MKIKKFVRHAAIYGWKSENKINKINKIMAKKKKVLFSMVGRGSEFLSTMKRNMQFQLSYNSLNE